MAKKQSVSQKESIESNVLSCLEDAAITYPWYQTVNGCELEQGDILLNVPIPEIQDLLYWDATKPPSVILNDYNLIIMNQSCDLAANKIDYVMLCPIYFKNDLTEHLDFKKESRWEEVRLNKIMGYHLLNKSDIQSNPFDFILVELKRIHTIKLDLLKDFASKQENRVRLMPPYREKLAQSFGNFIGRIGLPTDIPKFTK